MKKQNKKLTHINFLLYFGIPLLLLGILLSITHFYLGSWINLIPSSSAPIIASLVMIIGGLILVIGWLKHFLKGTKYI